MQSYISSDRHRTFGVIFVDHPSSGPNRPVSIPHDSFFSGAHEMKTVDGVTYVVLRVGRWLLSSSRASLCQFGVTQIDGLLGAAVSGILAKDF